MITNFFTYMTIFWNAVISLITGEETAVIGGLASVFDKMEYAFAYLINSIL